jgi:hypothetical protein
VKAIPTPEATLQAQVIVLARLQGWLVHHTRPAQNRRGQWGAPIQGDAGFPDLVLVRAGHLIIRELKAEGARPSAEQRVWLEALEGVGHIETGIWRPSDFSEIEQTLRRD